MTSGAISASSAAARRRARRLAAQALYQWQLTGMALQAVADQFLEDDGLSEETRTYFTRLMDTVGRYHVDLDKLIALHADRPVAQLDPVERSILLVGMAELAHFDTVPFRVVISEAMALGKRFGAQDSHKYINAVLDRGAHTLRAGEFGKAPAGR